MDPISLIIGALAAGATAGLSDSAQAAVSDLYQRVKTKFAGKPDAALALTKHETKPEVWDAPLREALAEADAAGDPDVVALAERIMALVDPKGAEAGTYIVNMPNAKGAQVGDRNVQTNHFGN